MYAFITARPVPGGQFKRARKDYKTERGALNALARVNRPTLGSVMDVASGRRIAKNW